MYVIIACIIVAMLKNAAGSVGIIMAGGAEGANLIGALQGGAGTATKGTFSTKTGAIKLG